MENKTAMQTGGGEKRKRSRRRPNKGQDLPGGYLFAIGERPCRHPFGHATSYLLLVDIAGRGTRLSGGEGPLTSCFRLSSTLRDPRSQLRAVQDSPLHATVAAFSDDAGFRWFSISPYHGHGALAGAEERVVREHHRV